MGMLLCHEGQRLFDRGVADSDGRGELRADILPRAGCPRGILWGSAMKASRRGKVSEGFDPDAKRGKVVQVCEM